MTRHIGAVVLIAMTAFLAQPSYAAPVDAARFKLPEERLMLLAGNSEGATLIGPDTIKWTGRSAEVLVYRVFVPPIALEGGVSVAEEVEVQRFDCDANTYQSLGASEYNPTSAEAFTMPEGPSKAVEERTMTSRVAAVVCGKIKLPDGNVAKDRATAKAMVMQALAPR